jgi:BirA family biotin operon repressor/biotin-[acetyl-CoA-carboxylase] ligase
VQGERGKVKVERTESTNTLTKELLAKGEWPEGERFLYTGFQTAGRGQAGNGWESEEGKNLLCSVLIGNRASDIDHPFYLNVLVSVAVHRVIQSELCQAKPVCTLSGEADLTIKWPNDIYWQDKKVAGILIENAIIGNELKYSIAGIGLNVNQTTFVSNALNPVSMKLITGAETNIDALMQALMTQIEAVEAMSGEQVWTYYREHLYRKEGFWRFIEREVSLAPTMNYSPSLEERDGERLDKSPFLARIADILPDGEIVLQDQQGKERKYHFKQIRYVL